MIADLLLTWPPFQPLASGVLRLHTGRGLVDPPLQGSAQTKLFALGLSRTLVFTPFLVFVHLILACGLQCHQR